jgi:hypothetical protein
MCVYLITFDSILGYQKNNKMRTGKAGGSVKMQVFAHQDIL